MKTPEQYMKLCKNLAYKYNAPWMIDDLISEGLVAIYSELEQDPRSNRVILVAKEAMWEYANLKTRPVSLPDVNEARYITTDNTSWIDEHSNYSDEALNWLYLVMTSSQGTLSHDDVSTESPEEIIIKKNTVKVTFEVAERVLNEKDFNIFLMFFRDEMKQSDIASELKISQSGVAQKLERMCETVRKAVKYGIKADCNKS